MAAPLRALRRASTWRWRSASYWSSSRLGSSSRTESSDRSGSTAVFASPGSWSCSWNRGMGTMSSLPESSDPVIKKALKTLYAINWYEIDDSTQNLVEEALKSGKGGSEDRKALENSWSAALAVEKFYGTLDTLRKAIDDLMGLSGEKTGPLPETHQRALEAVHSKYVKYLSSFGDDEQYLKKKVELELGSVMILLKQRVSGLPPKWGDISLLGTSGLSGSYIEKRA